MKLKRFFTLIQIKLSKYTIAQRLLSAFLIQIIIVLLGSSYIVFISFNNYKLFINNSNEINNYTISKTIEQYINGMEQATKFPVIFSSFENNPYVYTFLSKPSDDKLERLIYYQEIQNDAQRLFDVYPFLSSLSIFELNHEMTYLESGITYKNYRYDNLDFYKKTIDVKGSPVIWADKEVSLIDSNYDSTIYSSRAIMNVDHIKPIGIIMASVDLKEVLNYFENNKLFPEQTLTFISPEGKILIGEDDCQIINNNMNDLIHNIKKINSTKNNISSSILNYNKNVYSFSTFNNGYVCVIKTPKTLYTYYAIKSQIAVFIMIFILIITMLFLVNIVVKSILDPLAKLKLQSKRIKDGYLISEVEFEGNDEIADFTNSFNKMTKEINFLVNEVYKKDLIKSKLELQMLVAQINPHFLYNSLENIRSKAYLNDQNEVSEMISLLGKIIRRSLSSYDRPVKVHEELEGIYEYIALAKYRSEDKIDFIISVDYEILEYDIIILILQPLVENALSHGLAEINNGGTIEIIGYMEDCMIVFKVIDNGKGLTTQELANLNLFIEEEDYSLSSIGLRNVNRRIKSVYGKEFGLELKSIKDSGFMVTLKIPIKIN